MALPLPSFPIELNNARRLFTFLGSFVDTKKKSFEFFNVFIEKRLKSSIGRKSSGKRNYNSSNSLVVYQVTKNKKIKNLNRFTIYIGYTAYHIVFLRFGRKIEIFFTANFIYLF